MAEIQIMVRTYPEQYMDDGLGSLYGARSDAPYL